ncbi:MAG: hypothetical protein ABI999_02675 [Acidobacteriota bacterium]
MRLRINGNSSRLRLTRTEAEHLAIQGVVKKAIEFGTAPGESLVYRICLDASVESSNTVFANNELTLRLHPDVAAEWTATEQVGIEAHHDIGNGRFLHILIEKDFACRTPRAGNDDPDTFAHPSGSKRAEDSSSVRGKLHDQRG